MSRLDQIVESQRVSILQSMVGFPSRTGEERLPWVIVQKILNPNGVASLRRNLIQLLQS